MSRSTSGVWVGAATFVMGAAWMISLTTLNASLQMILASRMRPPRHGFYLTAMAISMSTGSLIWGRVAGATSLGSAHMIAAATLIVAAAISLRFGLAKSLI